MTQDQLHRYLFEQLHVRGELVQLETTIAAMLQNHQYPEPIKQLLAELALATALITATLKFDGDISVQIQGDGPISYIVVNGNNHLEMRGLAKLQGEIGATDLHSLIGKGYMTITINPKNGERYQGVVPLSGDTIAACVAGYFAQSEQLPTRIWLAVDLSQGKTRASGLLLQILPGEKQQALDDFSHLVALTNTVRDNELLELDAHTLLLRLYHEDNPTIFPPYPVSYKCGCSREKTIIALSQFNHAELVAQVKAEGVIHVDCQFCNTKYGFDLSDIENI